MPSATSPLLPYDKNSWTDAQFLWKRVNTQGTPPKPRCCHSLVSYKDRYLLAFGGGTTSPSTEFSYTELSVLDLETQTWFTPNVKNATIAGSRFSHTAVIYKDKMLVYGGTSSERVLCSDLVELDLTTWTWSYVHHVPPEPEGPGERHMHSAHIWKDRMYVVMGDPSTSHIIMWYLDLLTYTWHDVPLTYSATLFGYPMFSLFGHSTAVEGDYLYVFGGCSRIPSNASFASPHTVQVYSCSLYRFHFPTNQWSEPFIACNTRPPGRYAGAMTVCDGVVYIFGGDATHNTVYFDDWWTLDMSQPNAVWKEILRSSKTGQRDCERPSARSGSAYTTTNAALYVLGGELPPSSPTGEVGCSNELFRCPLKLSHDVSLSENAARWLSVVPRHRLNTIMKFRELPGAPGSILKKYQPSPTMNSERISHR